MQIVSAYLIAAAAVEEGNYDEDYDITEDPDFVDFMEDGDQDIVGDYIELELPTGGTDPENFTGNKFCTDWQAAFVRPFEYMQIVDGLLGITGASYPSTEDGADWEDYKINTVRSNRLPEDQNILVPKFLDNDNVSKNSKHINMWFASVGIRYGQTGNPHLIGLSGCYVPKTFSWRINANYPTKGYAVFSMSQTSAILSLPYYEYSYNWGEVIYNGSNSWGGGSAENQKLQFIKVYNVEAFKNYLSGLDGATALSIVNETLFVLAECNVKKNKIPS